MRLEAKETLLLEDTVTHVPAPYALASLLQQVPCGLQGGRQVPQATGICRHVCRFVRVLKVH